MVSCRLPSEVEFAHTAKFCQTCAKLIVAHPFYQVFPKEDLLDDIASLHLSVYVSYVSMIYNAVGCCRDACGQCAARISICQLCGPL